MKKVYIIISIIYFSIFCCISCNKITDNPNRQVTTENLMGRWRAKSSPNHNMISIEFHSGDCLDVTIPMGDTQVQSKYNYFLDSVGNMYIFPKGEDTLSPQHCPIKFNTSNKITIENLPESWDEKIAVFKRQ